jgi:hypothetical protein
MGRGLPLVGIAVAVAVAASVPAVRSGAAEPVAPACVGQTLRPVAWSRDGRWLAFNRPVGPEAFALTLVDVRTGRFRTARTSDEEFGISWSPAGATLAATSGREIYAGAPRGRLRLIAEGCFGAWSPGGKRIAFARGGWIITSNPDGRAKKRLLRAAGVQSWSPDGRRLAVVRYVPVNCRPYATRKLRVAVFRFHRRVLRRLTGDRRPFFGVAAFRGDQGTSGFSSDGRWLAYAEESPCAEGRAVFDHEPETFVAGRSDRIGFGVPIWAPSVPLVLLHPIVFGRTSTVATPAGAELMHVAFGGDFAWSPDSTRIAYTQQVRDPIAGEPRDVYVVLVRAGERPRKLAEGGDDPAWSPGGSHIAFLRTTTRPLPCRHELFVVSSAGGQPRRLVGC